MSSTSSVLKDVEDQLTCPVCLSLYEDPKVLNCHHAFCVGCLKKCVVTDGDRLFVRCSTCRAETLLPAGGVQNLEVAFNVNKLFDTRAKLMTASIGAENVVLDRNRCGVHPGREKELYCETCSLLICFQCGLEGEAHYQHKYYLASKLKDQASLELRSSLDSLIHQHEGFRAAINDLDDHVERLYKKKDAIKREICEVAASLREEISAGELNAVEKLYSMVEERVAKLTPYRDKLEGMSSKFQNCISQFLEPLERNDPCELVSIKNELCGKASHLCETLQPHAFLSLDGIGEPEFFVNSSKIKQSLLENFSVYTCDVCPSSFQVAGEGLSKAVVGERNSFCIQALTSDGFPCKNPVQGLHCQLVSELTGVSISLSILEQSANSFVNSYSPPHKGWYILSIEYKGKHISGSPFRIATNLKGEVVFQMFHSIDTAPFPEAMVVSSGRLIVSSRFSLTLTTGKVEKKRDLFEGSRLLILALKQGNTFFAVDHPCLKHLLEVDISNGDQRSILYFTHEIADVAFSGIYNCLLVLLNVADAVAQEYISILSLSNPSKLLSFGSHGHGKGQLSSPKGIAIDEESSRIFIADTKNNRIQTFNFKGKYLSKFGSKGWDTIVKPAALTFSCQKLFVGDSTNSIHMFDSTGVHLCCITLQSCSNIISLAVDECGILYACDYKNSKVLLF